jgi:hypothetical protein
MRKRRGLLSCVLGWVLVVGLAAGAAQAGPLPEQTVTLADVQSVLGGKFEGREVEPGIYNWEEVEGRRVVEIWVRVPAVTTVESLKATLLQNGEPVDDVAGVGDAAMYRPQSNCATTEKKSKSGESQWLEVRVHNVEGAAAAADTKRFAIELAKQGAARL